MEVSLSVKSRQPTRREQDHLRDTGKFYTASVLNDMYSDSNSWSSPNPENPMSMNPNSNNYGSGVI